MYCMCLNCFTHCKSVSSVVNNTRSVNTFFCISSTWCFFMNICFTTAVASHLSFLLSRSSLAVYGIWNRSSTKLTNTLFLSSVKCYFISLYTSPVKLWSPLRITYTTWLSCDKVMNYRSFQNISFSLPLPCLSDTKKSPFCCSLPAIPLLRVCVIIKKRLNDFIYNKVYVICVWMRERKCIWMVSLGLSALSGLLYGPPYYNATYLIQKVTRPDD